MLMQTDRRRSRWRWPRRVRTSSPARMGGGDPAGGICASWYARSRLPPFDARPGRRRPAAPRENAGRELVARGRLDTVRGDRPGARELRWRDRGGDRDASGEAVAAALALVVFASATAALAAGRVALMVGNSTYAHIGRLPTLENDAVDMAAALRRIGFDVT